MLRDLMDSTLEVEAPYCTGKEAEEQEYIHVTNTEIMVTLHDIVWLPQKEGGPDYE